MTALSNWTSTLAAMTLKLSKVMADSNREQIQQWRADIIDVAASSRPAVVKAIAQSRRPADIHAVRSAVLTACKRRATISQAETATQMSQRVSLAEHRRRKVLAVAQWDNNCRRWLHEEIGSAHRWANSPNKPRLVLRAPAIMGDSEFDVLKFQTDEWSKVWKADDPIEVADAYDAVKQLIQTVRAGNVIPDVAVKKTPSRLRSNLDKYKKRPGIGLDYVSMQELLGGFNDCLAAYCDV